MRNVWLMTRVRKGTRKTIRRALGNPPDIDDDQIDVAIEMASKKFYQHRRDPWQLALEGAILMANVILCRIRMMAGTQEAADNYTAAIIGYRDWIERVEDV